MVAMRRATILASLIHDALRRPFDEVLLVALSVTSVAQLVVTLWIITTSNSSTVAIFVTALHFVAVLYLFVPALKRGIEVRWECGHLSDGESQALSVLCAVVAPAAPALEHLSHCFPSEKMMATRRLQLELLADDLANEETVWRLIYRRLRRLLRDEMLAFRVGHGVEWSVYAGRFDLFAFEGAFVILPQLCLHMLSFDRHDGQLQEQHAVAMIVLLVALVLRTPYMVSNQVPWEPQVALFAASVICVDLFAAVFVNSPFLNASGSGTIQTPLGFHMSSTRGDATWLHLAYMQCLWLATGVSIVVVALLAPVQSWLTTHAKAASSSRTTQLLLCGKVFGKSLLRVAALVVGLLSARVLVTVYLRFRLSLRETSVALSWEFARRGYALSRDEGNRRVKAITAYVKKRFSNSNVSVHDHSLETTRDSVGDLAKGVLGWFLSVPVSRPTFGRALRAVLILLGGTAFVVSELFPLLYTFVYGWGRVTTLQQVCVVGQVAALGTMVVTSRRAYSFYLVYSHLEDVRVPDVGDAIWMLHEYFKPSTADTLCSVTNGTTLPAEVVTAGVAPYLVDRDVTFGSPLSLTDLSSMKRA